MRYTLLKIIIVLAFLFCLDYGFSKVLDYMYQNNYLGQSGGEINYFIKKKKNTKVLFMGSSRVRHNVDIIKPGFYNLSHNGMHLSFQKGLINILKTQKALPKSTLFLNIEIEDFYKKNEVEIEDDITYLKYFYNKNSYIKSEINKVEPTQKIKQLFFLYKFNGSSISLIKNYIQTLTYSSFNNNGYVAIPPTSMDSIRLETTIVPQSKFNIEWNSELFKTLKKLQNQLAKENVELVLFTAPFYKDISPYEIFNYELKKYGINNYHSFENITTLNHPKLWTDNSHLNALGAELFSSYLVKYFNL